MENMKDFVPDWQEADAYLQFPDLKVVSLEEQHRMCSIKLLSQKVYILTVNGRKKSSGSWIPYLDYDVSFFHQYNK